MKAIRLAFSFIRVPGLFVSLLMWPLVLGVLAGLGQVVVSGLYIHFVTKTSDQFKEELGQEDESNPLLRRWVYGSEKRLDDPAICRWTGGIQPADPNCELKPFDVVIRSQTPETLVIEDFVSYYRGAVQRIHVCPECSSNIQIERVPPPKGARPKTVITSLKALAVLFLVESERGRDLDEYFVSARSDLDKLKQTRGEIVLIPAGFVGSVDITQTAKTMLLIINISFLILIATWISLKAHRKVLDYFARNDALLPLVAACGKRDFYMSLWWITLLRVAAFLLAVGPATYFVYAEFIPADTLKQLIGSPGDFCLWVLTVTISLTAITLIASISELRHRTSWLAFLYKYVPFAIWIIGSILWGIFIFVDGTLAYQNIIASIPVFGLSAIILSPIVKANQNVILAHALLSTLLAVATVKLNSKWFAAHLEEL